MTVTLSTNDIESFRTLIAERFGLYFEDAKQEFIADVLRQRMESTGCDHFSAYKQRIISMADSPQEIRALSEQLTVGETYFFRYADQFRALTDLVLPERIRSRSAQRQLYILSAGCASGEEAYSIAILLRERFPDLASWDIRIHGIDLNAAVVEKALSGRYTKWSLRETPEELRERYFRTDGRELVIDTSIRSAVTFEKRNLAEEDPLFWRNDVFDIIFCRNVTMYFTHEASQAVIARLTRSLLPGGFLFLGHAETLRGVSHDFHLRHTHETFYYQRRLAHETLGEPVSGRISANAGPVTKFASIKEDPGDSWFEIIQRASTRIAHLTNGKNGNAAYTSADIAKQTSSYTAPVSVWDRTLAVEFMREERFAEAIAILRALPEEAKADPEAQLLLAILLTNSGDLAEAEKVSQHLLESDELNAGAQYLMALCKEHAGDAKTAMQHDQAAVYLDSAFAMPHLHMGLLAKRSADVEVAKRELGNALMLLAREDASRILLFGGGFTREALVEFCRAELRACGGSQ